MSDKFTYNGIVPEPTQRNVYKYIFIHALVTCDIIFDLSLSAGGITNSNHRHMVVASPAWHQVLKLYCSYHTLGGRRRCATEYVYPGMKPSSPRCYQLFFVLYPILEFHENPFTGSFILLSPPSLSSPKYISVGPHISLHQGHVHSSVYVHDSWRDR